MVALVTAEAEALTETEDLHSVGVEVLAEAATVLCTKPLAATAVRNVRFLSDQPRANLSIVVIVLKRWVTAEEAILQGRKGPILGHKHRFPVQTMPNWKL